MRLMLLLALVLSFGCTRTTEPRQMSVIEDARELMHSSTIMDNGDIGHVFYCGSLVQIGDERAMVWWVNRADHEEWFRQGVVLTFDSLGGPERSRAGDGLGEWEGPAYWLGDIAGLKKLR